MAGNIFKHKFGKDPKEFKTIGEVNRFVEKKTGHKLKIKKTHPDVCTSRGSIFPIEQMNANEIFELALKKKWK